jgi:hypothetical protein
MVGDGLYIAIGIIAVVASFLVIWFSWVVRRGHAVGTKGLVQRSRLTCPKCSQPFNYDWVPGVSLRAVRLGKGRYMTCPLCHQWSYFDIYDTMVARTDRRDPDLVTVGPR